MRTSGYQYNRSFRSKSGSRRFSAKMANQQRDTVQQIIKTQGDIELYFSGDGYKLANSSFGASYDCLSSLFMSSAFTKYAALYDQFRVDKISMKLTPNAINGLSFTQPVTFGFSWLRDGPQNASVTSLSSNASFPHKLVQITLPHNLDPWSSGSCQKYQLGSGNAGRSFYSSIYPATLQEKSIFLKCASVYELVSLIGLKDHDDAIANYVQYMDDQLQFYPLFNLFSYNSPLLTNFMFSVEFSFECTFRGTQSLDIIKPGEVKPSVIVPYTSWLYDIEFTDGSLDENNLLPLGSNSWNMAVYQTSKQLGMQLFNIYKFNSSQLNTILQWYVIIENQKNTKQIKKATLKRVFRDTDSVPVNSADGATDAMLSFLIVRPTNSQLDTLANLVTTNVVPTPSGLLSVEQDHSHLDQTQHLKVDASMADVNGNIDLTGFVDLGAVPDFENGDILQDSGASNVICWRSLNGQNVNQDFNIQNSGPQYVNGADQNLIQLDSWISRNHQGLWFKDVETFEIIDVANLPFDNTQPFDMQNAASIAFGDVLGVRVQQVDYNVSTDMETYVFDKFSCGSNVNYSAKPIRYFVKITTDRDGPGPEHPKIQHSISFDPQVISKQTLIDIYNYMFGFFACKMVFTIRKHDGSIDYIDPADFVIALTSNEETLRVDMYQWMQDVVNVHLLQGKIWKRIKGFFRKAFRFIKDKVIPKVKPIIDVVAPCLPPPYGTIVNVVSDTVENIASNVNVQIGNNKSTLEDGIQSLNPNETQGVYALQQQFHVCDVDAFGEPIPIDVTVDDDTLWQNSGDPVLINDQGLAYEKLSSFSQLTFEFEDNKFRDKILNYRQLGKDVAIQNRCKIQFRKSGVPSGYKSHIILGGEVTYD